MTASSKTGAPPLKPNSPIRGTFASSASTLIAAAKPEYAKHRFEVYEVGLHHIAFNTDTREQVECVHELVKKLGGQILDCPAEFSYDPEGWYAVYFTGPDGLKFEVVHQPSTVRRYSELMRMAESVMHHH
jgi:catechol 2,3-dioxygenase-like lactoylglutathione lyase family enzyme